MIPSVMSLKRCWLPDGRPRGNGAQPLPSPMVANVSAEELAELVLHFSSKSQFRRYVPSGVGKCWGRDCIHNRHGKEGPFDAAAARRAELSH